MFGLFWKERKSRLMDSPANGVILFLGIVFTVFFNVWGLMLPLIVASLAGMEEQQNIYQLIPETDEKRRCRRLTCVAWETLFVTVLAEINGLLMRSYSVSVLLQSKHTFVLLLLCYATVFYRAMLRSFYYNKDTDKFTLWDEWGTGVLILAAMDAVISFQDSYLPMRYLWIADIALVSGVIVTLVDVYLIRCKTKQKMVVGCGKKI